MRASLGIVGPDAPTGWVHLATYGAWKGHPAGEFAFDDDAFESIVTNFERQKNPVPVVVGHPDETVPAEGWIQKLEVRDDGLWALVEWRPGTAELIRDGAWKFCSVVVDFGAIDRVTGEASGVELYELGLTNTPFVDGQTPINLDRFTRRRGDERTLSMDPKKVLAAIAKALGLPADAAPEKMKSALDALIGLMAALGADPLPADVADLAKDPKACERVTALARDVRKLADMMDPTTVQAADMGPEEMAAASAIFTKLKEATGLDPAGLLAAVESNLDACVAALAASTDSGMVADGEAAAMQASLSAAKARVEAVEFERDSLRANIVTLSKQLEERDAKDDDARINAAVESGHILAHQKAVFVTLARTNRAALDEYLGAAAKAPAVPTGKLVKASADVTGNDDMTPRDDSEAFVVRSMKLGKKSNEQIKKALKLHRANAGAEG